MQRLEERTAVLLGHHIDTKTFFFVIGFHQRDRWTPFTVEVRRPAEGGSSPPSEQPSYIENSRLVDVRCPVCDGEMHLRVRGVERTRRVRKRYLLIAAVGLAVSAAFVLLGFAVYIPLPSTLGTVTLVGFFLGLLVAGVAGYYWWIEDGLRLYSSTTESDRAHWRLDSKRPLYAVN